MNGILWILVGGMSGWLTGKLIGEKGYGTLLLGSYASSLDVLFGAIGAAFGGYLFFWAVSGDGSLFSTYTALLGAITLVGACRLISASYLRSPSYKGMSRTAFNTWHDRLIVKELASWKPRRRQTSKTVKENCQP
jgi:uncharacterized membrane protein YeaQ/YmgE (transglycosylase-associated protein family)